MKAPSKSSLIEQIRILDELCFLAKQQTLLAQAENRSLRHDMRGFQSSLQGVWVQNIQHGAVEDCAMKYTKE